MIFDQSGSTIPLIYFPKQPLRATPGPKQPTDHRQQPQAQTVHHISLDLALRRLFVAKKICKVPKFVTKRIHHWVKFLHCSGNHQSLRSVRDKGQKTYYIHDRNNLKKKRLKSEGVKRPSCAINNNQTARCRIASYPLTCLAKKSAKDLALENFNKTDREITDFQNIWDGLKHVEDWVNSLGTGQLIRDVEYINITY